MARKDQATVVNRDELYNEVFRKRGVKFIRHYPTPQMREMSIDLTSQVEQISHVWSVGDRFFKLAFKHYGDPSLWWIIARFNSKPTESHLEIGDIVQIPVPLTDALRIMRA